MYHCMAQEALFLPLTVDGDHLEDEGLLHWKKISSEEKVETFWRL